MFLCALCVSVVHFFTCSKNTSMPTQDHFWSQAAAALRGQSIPPDPTLDEERQLLLHHFDLVCQRFGDSKGSLLMRKFACCYAQGRTGAREFRSRVVKVSTPTEFRSVVESYFPGEAVHS